MKEKLKQKKGFTIVELLAVIVIIAVLATIVITSVIGYREKAKEEYMNTLKDQLTLAAKSYYSDNPKELPRGQIEGNYKIYNTSVMASNLAQNNYFTNELVDESGNSCEEQSYTVVRNINGVYNYEPCLICNGTVLNESEYCKVGGNEVVNNEPYCSVYVSEYEQNGSEFTKKIHVDTNTTEDPVITSGNINITVLDEENSYVVYKPGTYTFEVSQDGKTASCGITVYGMEDVTNPTCTITLSKDTNTDYEYIVKGNDSGGICLIENTATNEKVFISNASYSSIYDEHIHHESGDKTEVEQTFNYRIVDCSGNDNLCDITISPKTTPPSGSEGDSETCIGDDCNPIPDDDTCDQICTPNADFNYNYSTCTYYHCSSDGCSKTKYSIPGCGEYEDDEDEPLDCSTGALLKPSGACCNGCGYPGESEEICDNGVSKIYYVESDCTCYTLKGGSGCSEEVNPDTGCFLEGTKVLTRNGYKNIEDIEIGDYVLSYNKDSKQTEYNKVYKKFVHTNNNEDIYELTINGKVLKVTEAHRFYVKEKGKTEFIWKEAKSLSVGDILLNNNNKERKISNIISYSHFGTVYNFAVENNHNYFVSENGYLVHNCKLGEDC